MDVFLDDRPITPHDHGCSLGQLLDDTKASLAAGGRIVVGVCCDGIDIIHEDFEAQLDQPATTFDRIELTSAEPLAMVADALAGAIGLLDESQSGAEKVVDLLSAGQTESALHHLGDCCRAWIQIHQAICQAIEMLDIDPGAFEVSSQPLEALLAKPIDHLAQIKSAVTTADFVLLADLIRYEFPDSIACWRTIAGALQRYCTNPPQAPAPPASTPATGNRMA